MGGYDWRLPIMEDADLCIRLHMAGGWGGWWGREGLPVVGSLAGLVLSWSGARCPAGVIGGLS